ncbi:MAG: protein-L-isoaspartate(D-aspartate) O-methyltransferase [Desulfitobacterium hafniense]|nr:protein-L-isoaspartate(D-aspartate) O-methyltransferase [Desulfitobacterium hafniense]
MPKNLDKVNELDNYEAERSWMVENQLIRRGIYDEKVLKSMLAVPRHRFVSTKFEKYAYYDEPLEIEEGQTISQPYIVALMAQALELSSKDKVLEIGTGSGYSAAVLSIIADQVYSIERHSSLAEQAMSRFRSLGYDNIHVKLDDGTKGWADEAPFDAIIVTAGGPAVPKALLEQLAVGGRLVIPVGKRHEQKLLRIRKKADGDFLEEDLGEVRFVPLIGDQGWEH